MPISPPGLLAKFCSANFLSCVNYYIEHMATFTTLAPSNISAIQRYLGLAKVLSSKKFRLYSIVNQYSYSSLVDKFSMKVT